MEKGRQEELIAFLRGSPIFSVLSEEQIESMSQLARIEEYSPNELILKEGEPSTHFYSILEGQVEVHSSNGSSRRLGRGEFFGETTLVANLTRSANVLALRKTRCLVVKGSELRSYPSLAVRLLEESARQNRKKTTTAPPKGPESVALPGRGEEREKEEIIEFKSKRTKVLFDYVVKCFIRDYMMSRLYFEQAGWRSLGEISEGTRIPRDSLYGRHGSHSPTLAELVVRGLIETRIFKDQRGRGGEVVKVRLAYDKEPVKRYVDRTVLGRDRK